MRNPVKAFRRLSRKKKFIVIGVLLAIAGLLMVGYSRATSKPKYTLVEVTKDDITETVSETGSVSVNGWVDVYSPTNGIVEEVFVKNGDVVSNGQKLMVIRSSATEQEKAQAQSTYLAAKNSLDTAQATLHSLQSALFAKWDIYKQLAESDKYEESDGTPKTLERELPEFHIAQKDWFAAESNYKKQQAVISQAQVAVHNAYLLYESTQNAIVKATSNGTIANLSVDRGSSVKTVPSAVSPLVVIAGIAHAEVVVSVSETDITKIKEGQEVVLDVNVLNGHTYTGNVKRVDTIGTNIQGVIRYNIYIEVTDADEQLRTGMKADATITTNKVTDVIAVPNAAIKPYQGKRAVRIPDPKTKEVTYIPVEIGIKGKEKTQILSGLEEGQMIITSLSNEQLKRSGLFGN